MSLFSPAPNHIKSGPQPALPKFIERTSYWKCPVLTHIFHISLKTDIVPNDRKHAGIVPVNNKGSKCKPCNYRPTCKFISFTSISSKLMEHILVSNIMSFYDKHDILSHFQHGFRSKHSCETQPISFTEEVHDNLKQGQQTDVIVMDFSKIWVKSFKKNTTNFS
jgi:hypothetical protein